MSAARKVTRKQKDEDEGTKRIGKRKILLSEFKKSIS
jgi:hypothetical protein